MKKFLSEIADETVDLKSLGIGGTDKQNDRYAVPVLWVER